MFVRVVVKYRISVYGEFENFISIVIIEVFMVCLVRCVVFSMLLVLLVCLCGVVLIMVWLLGDWNSLKLILYIVNIVSIRLLGVLWFIVSKVSNFMYIMVSLILFSKLVVMWFDSLLVIILVSVMVIG